MLQFDDGYDDSEVCNGCSDLADQIVISAGKEHLQSTEYVHVLEWGLINLDPREVNKRYFRRIKKALVWYQDSVNDCENFFHSELYETLTSISTEYMMRNLEKAENEWMDEFDFRETSDKKSLVLKAVEFCEESIALDKELEKEDKLYEDELHRRNAEKTVPDTEKNQQAE